MRDSPYERALVSVILSMGRVGAEIWSRDGYLLASGDGSGFVEAVNLNRLKPDGTCGTTASSSTQRIDHNL